MKQIILILSLFISASVFSQANPFPKWASDYYQEHLSHLFDVYKIERSSFFEADFNGDGSTDIAIPVLNKASRKKGVVVIHSKTLQHFILGAGSRFGNGGDNFTWLTKVSIYNKPTASETKYDKETGDILGGKTIKLNRPGLFLQNFEDGGFLSGGIAYWNGKNYTWIQQGE